MANENAKIFQQDPPSLLDSPSLASNHLGLCQRCHRGNLQTTPPAPTERSHHRHHDDRRWRWGSTIRLHRLLLCLQLGQQLFLLTQHRILEHRHPSQCHQDQTSAQSWLPSRNQVQLQVALCVGTFQDQTTMLRSFLVLNSPLPMWVGLLINCALNSPHLLIKRELYSLGCITTLTTMLIRSSTVPFRLLPPKKLSHQAWQYARGTPVSSLL